MQGGKNQTHFTREEQTVDTKLITSRDFPTKFTLYLLSTDGFQGTVSRRMFFRFLTDRRINGNCLWLVRACVILKTGFKLRCSNYPSRFSFAPWSCLQYEQFSVRLSKRRMLTNRSHIMANYDWAVPVRLGLKPFHTKRGSLRRKTLRNVSKMYVNSP